jgi:site-specific DNA-methyltransferase (adenine-specific)
MSDSNAKQSFRPNLIQGGFGSRLRKQRLASGYSLALLSSRVKTTKGYLSRLESGKAKPSRDMIGRIARVLNVDATPLYVLAGYLPTDVRRILCRYPMEAPLLLREAFAEYATVAPVEDGVQKPKSVALLSTVPPKPRILEGLYELVCGDCFDWMEQRAPDSIHAIVTDPPYGLREYTDKEKEKLRRGRGGVWRIPPSFDGCTRNPLPRFTVLTEEDKASLRDFIARWALKAFRVLVPGGHVFIASNPLVSHLVYLALIEAGFEKRGEIIRLVQTLRGGDRPKNAHREFGGVTVMPRSGWEPWGLFRKPCEGRVQDNLRKWKTGGLRRVSDDQPFCDVIKSAPTRTTERQIASHPSLKPQAFMGQVSATLNQLSVSNSQSKMADQMP